ncbi:hypothetical protein CRG98_041098 [Punica granatum]|uniref:Uncharacterized protein n=1 Tax=Punica granatum TaxID=22663 RepID=A0A2I0I3W7_PUNGR|nr:hypothetical protein CRG98_041098 [Punica granatum]
MSLGTPVYGHQDNTELHGQEEGVRAVKKQGTGRGLALVGHGLPQLVVVDSGLGFALGPAGSLSRSTACSIDLQSTCYA